MRKKTRQIQIGPVSIGGDAPIRVQSMTKTDTRDFRGTLEQIHQLQAAGCEIVRVAVKDLDTVEPFRIIIKESPIPVVADIHFDYRLALKAVEAGAHGLRINPGNIGNESRVREVVKCAMDRRVPIRVGVNAGSLQKALLLKHGGPTPAALVESALNSVRMIERCGYDQIKISIKASDVMTVIEGYSLLSEKVDYPLHLGVTEAGNTLVGSMKSALAFGVLLSKGIGDTLRVSLTAPPIEEVRSAFIILDSLGVRRQNAVTVISCPTCGRCEWDLFKAAGEIEARVKDVKAPLVVAVMGCPVNGPGEAREADIGVAGGGDACVLFKKGKVLRKVSREEVVDALVQEIQKSVEDLGLPK